MYRYLIFSLLFFSSCLNTVEDNIPEPSLDAEVLRKILVERHLLLAQITSFQYPDRLSNSLVDSLFHSICLKNGSSSEEFEQNWDYYNSHDLDQLIEVYDMVIEDLKILELKEE